MRLVVGLGNPGSRYRRTRHNVGFMVVDRLAARWRIAVGGRRHEAEVGVGEIAGVRAVLSKPQTFMNASGEAVARLRRAYRVTPAEIVVIHDDLDIAPGRLRVRGGGSAGGHQGVASLIAALGAEFARVRVGIGRPPGGSDPVDFVLSPFTAEEWAMVEGVIERAAEGVESLFREGLERTMNVFNVRCATGG